MLMRGQVNTVWTDGEVEVPYSDAPALEATAKNPIARMDVFEPHYDTGKWRRCDWQEIQYVRDLQKIESLPELASPEDTLTEGQEADEQVNNIENLTEDETPMATKPDSTKEIHDVDSRIVELKEQHQEQVRELNGQIGGLEANERTVNRLREMLGVAEEQDPVLALQALQSTLRSLQRENIELLETAIVQEVGKFVKVQWAQGVVEQYVRNKKPLSRAEVVTYTQEALDNPHIAVIVKNAVQQAMGPNVENPKTQTPDAPMTEPWIIMPELEGGK